MRMFRTPRRTSLMLVAMMIAAVCATAQPAFAADECTYSFQNNEAPDLKIKTVVDGKEVTQILLTSGRTESITVTADDTVVVRRPSDRERLFRASNCEGAGAVVEIGELPVDINISCDVEQFEAGGEAFRIRTLIGEAPAGSHVAYKAYNPVDDEDYVFLGSYRTNGQLDISHDDEITVPGDWRITSRIRLADGSKLPRVDCAIITIGDGGNGEIPADAIGHRNAGELPTSCWAVDRDLGDGEIVSDVTILNAGENGAYYARSTDSFLGAIDPAGGNYDPEIALIKIWRNERTGTYDCQRGWTGGVEIPTPNEAEGLGRVDVEVMIAVPAANGGTNVLWKIGQSGPAFGNGGAFGYSYHLTNTIDGQIARPWLGDIEDVDADLVDCDSRYVAMTSSSWGSTYIELLDLRTGASLDLPGFVGWDNVDEPVDYGFDCDGRFWYEGRDGAAMSVDLD